MVYFPGSLFGELGLFTSPLLEPLFGTRGGLVTLP